MDCKILLHNADWFPECSDNQAALLSSKIIGGKITEQILIMYNVCGIVLQAPWYSLTCSRPRSVCGSLHCPVGLSCSWFVSRHLFLYMFLPQSKELT
jgi:hypothetical protein